jgi:hypothetical protein
MRGFRVRRVLTLLLLCGVIAAHLVFVYVWVRSDERVFKLAGPSGTMVCISGGRLIFDRYANLADRPRTGVEEYNARYEWWFSFGWRPDLKWVAVPLWLPLIVLIAADRQAWLMARRARRPTGQETCYSCGYDRAGLSPHAPCPECGTASAKNRVHP